MIEVSWGELGVLTGLGLFLIGKQDLPKAARALGTYVGRTVGLLQGARARADRFAAQSELKQLQNELRSGLRELDAVKAEFAVSMSPGGMMGRNLGAMTANVNRKESMQPQQLSSGSYASNPAKIPATTSSKFVSDPISNLGNGTSSTLSDDVIPTPQTFTASFLAPSEQSVAAVAEQEWESQGIAFVSKAELRGRTTTNSNETGGSFMLANLLQQSLIFDQYDRVVAEQDSALQNKMEETMLKIQQKQNETRKPKKS